MTFAPFTALPRQSGSSAAWNMVAAYRRDAARRKVYRRTMDALTAYTDAELADIRVHRSQIGEIARAEAALVVPHR